MIKPSVHISRCLVALVICIVGGCASASAPLTVMTYNVQHRAGTDGKLDVARIAGVIRRCQPDLVALQEVDNQTDRTRHVDQSAELGRLTKMHQVFGVAMDYQNGKYGNVILSRLPIKSVRLVPLHGSGDKHEPRCVVAITCDVNHEEIVFASTH